MDSIILFANLALPAVIFLSRGFIFDAIFRVAHMNRKYKKVAHVDWAICIGFLAMAIGGILVIEVPTFPIDVALIGVILTLSATAVWSASSVQEEWTKNSR